MQLDPDLIRDYKHTAWQIVEELREQDFIHDLMGLPGGQERFEITQEIFRRLLPDECAAED